MSVLDAMVWSLLPEPHAIAQLASSIARGCSYEYPPTKVDVRHAVTQLSLPRGRIGIIRKATIEETIRQFEIREERTKHPSEPDLTLAERFAQRTRSVVRKVWKRCDYRRPSSSWAGGNEEIDVRIGEPDVESASCKVWSDNGKWSGRDVERTITVPHHWLYGIHKKHGGAITENCHFVLDRDESAGRILVIEPSRGFDLVARWRKTK